ncbi:MAG: hypothetical protein AAFQ13_01510 [Pseudomonadota bacterium]
MTKPALITRDEQAVRFREACNLLGGQRVAARYLGINERTVRALANPEGRWGKNVRDGHLCDLTAALIDHAENCRAMERLVSPAFAGNLTEDQRARHGKPDARRYDNRSD